MIENGKLVTVLYLCKRDNHCKGKCYEECHLTSEREHAKNDIPEDPWNHPEQFERDETPNKVYYTEKENEE